MKLVILAEDLEQGLASILTQYPNIMVKIGPYPIIIHIMRHYIRYGFKDFIIATGYKSNIFKNYFNNFKKSGISFFSKCF